VRKRTSEAMLLQLRVIAEFGGCLQSCLQPGGSSQANVT
jgi:hypothetical protein